MAVVNFFYEDIDFKLPQARKRKNWIKAVVHSEDKQIDELNFIFCSDEYLLEKNIQFLNHNTLTDIITFPYASVSGIAGDIFLSIERVKENSDKLDTLFEDELDRVIIHGVLHLLGYNDKNPTQKREIRKKEDLCLSLR